MNAQVHVAQGIVAGRVWSEQDLAQLRDIELAEQDARRQARRMRRR